MLLVPLCRGDGEAELGVPLPCKRSDACLCRALSLPGVSWLEQRKEQGFLCGGAGGVGWLCLDKVNGAERTHASRSWGSSGTSVGGSISVPF